MFRMPTVVHLIADCYTLGPDLLISLSIPEMPLVFLLIIISLGWQISAKLFRISECIYSVPTCSGCCHVPAVDIHVMAREYTCMVTVHFGGSTPHVPVAYGGSSHCGLLYPWQRFLVSLRIPQMPLEFVTNNHFFRLANVCAIVPNSCVH